MKYKRPATDIPGLGNGVFKNGATSRNRFEHGFGSQISSVLRHLSSAIKIALLVMFLVPATSAVFAQGTGSISGTARDSQGAVLPGTNVQLRNTATGVEQTVPTDSAGFYSFQALPVGHYDITFQKAGFANYAQTGIIVNIDTAREVDATMPVGANKQQVTVSATTLTVETRSTSIGEVIGGQQIVNMPLNGRAFTDLLALQPGVVPLSVAQFGSIAPAYNLNNGLLSISGARDMNTGYSVNGANTTEGYSGGTFLIPTLDSIAQFRIITSNGMTDTGNYAGGLVNVVTKSGTNKFHGDAFEFYRDTNLDARGYFDPTRGIFTQNQFGGTVGGPILHNKLFFFGDYQGTRQSVGQSTGLVLVPSAAERTGNFSDAENKLTGTVNGAYFAGLLASELGYPVTAGENYYTPGCTSSAVCVFPNALIPKAAWSPVSANTVALLPLPNSGQYFTTAANPETLRDKKGSVKIDADTRFGKISGYWHYDPWTDVSPYSSYGGSSLPGFPSTTTGAAQLYVASLTNTFGPTMVNIFTASYVRNANTLGLTGTGPSLASLGFAAPDDGGPYQESGVQYQNWPTLFFNNYTLGAPQSIVTQNENMYQGQDELTKVFRTHTLKFGGDYHWDQVNIAHPNNASNPGFSFNGTETGYDFADMLIGAPSSFDQGAPAHLNLRDFYLGLYAEDSWRASNNLTVNYGIRYDVNPYWADAQNRSPVVLLGKQSTQFPGAPEGYVFPGDAGVPHHLANIRWNDFSPRIGFAWVPDFSGSTFLHQIFGDAGKTSIRGAFGMYYTNVQGANTFNFSSAPYGLFYESPAPPLYAQPFITRASGQNQGQRFPVPPLDPTNIDWSEFTPIGGKVNPPIDNPTPYEEHMDLSIERSISQNTLLNVSYVATLGRHLILNADQNQGNPALCLSVSQPSQVVAGTATCGPFGENGVYYPVGGGVINGTRGPLGPNFEGSGLSLDIGNSSYHALQASFRHQSGRLSVLVSYTLSKAIDDGSSFGEGIVIGLPTDYFRAISAYDMRHIFAASYTYELPFDQFLRPNRATRGWKISGITQFTSGLPVTISEPDDRSLLGNFGNSPEGSGDPDLPDYTPGSIYADRNPRHGNAWFNTSLFSQEPLGTIGTSPKRFFYGPGLNNWDLSLMKDTPIHGDMMLELRAEFFNAFNHAQFTSVQGNFNNGPGSFGYVTSVGSGRIGQLAAKFVF